MLSKHIKKALSLVLSMVLLFSFTAGASAYASTASLNNKKNKIQSQINETEKKLSKLKAEKKETQEYIATLDKKIKLLQDNIDVLRAESNKIQKNIDTVSSNIKKTEDKINQIQKEIDKKQAEFDKTFADYCQRLRAIYISGNATNLQVLLSSKDLSSILTRSQMIKSISDKDSACLQDLMDTMDEIEKDKAELEKKRLELKEAKASLQKDKAKLTENINKVSAAKSELDKEVAEANALMRKLNNQSNEYKEAIEDNEEALKEIEDEIRRAQAAEAAKNPGSSSGSTGNGQYSGTFGYPTSYRGISAGYPNYSSGRYHGGVDFPCPSGSSVYAAASGTVIIAKNLNYSYGHYLVIDHGNGLATLYAHNTTLLVGVGDKVTKGQVIARSGSTGNSTGPHCHFEVRVNGTRVNPMNYL